MREKSARGGVWFDPRTKIILLILCVLSATMAPSLPYEIVLVLVVALFGIVCGKLRYSLISIAVYIAIYFLTLGAMQLNGTAQAMLVAFLGLVHKVYPCGILAGIIIPTTKVGEFLSAMNRVRLPRKVTIPLAVMLRYLPTIREDWRYIRDAMKLRDVSLSLKGIFTQPAMTVECIYVPLMMAASKTSDELAIASVTRGIENPAPRTSLVQIGIGMADIIAIAGFLAVFLIGQLCKEVFL